jgi:hypothetical protein
MPPLPAWCRAVPRVLLGLFIFWQLLFLPAANLCGLLTCARNRLAEWPPLARAAPDWAQGQGPLHRATEAVGGVTRRWAELTGQPQPWSLFAPEVGPDVAFVAVEFRWDDDPLPSSTSCRRLAPLAAGDLLACLTLHAAAAADERPAALPPVLLLSDNEPADLHAYFRLGRFRLRRCEGSIELMPASPADRADIPMADTWNQQIAEKVWSAGARQYAYLRRRLADFRRRRPDLPPPRQVILYTRTYRIPEPDSVPWTWQGPEQLPLVRWRPGSKTLERYNPVLPRFEKAYFLDGFQP